MRTTKILEIHVPALIGFLLIFLPGRPIAQEVSQNIQLDFRYGLHFSAADLHDRFGSSNGIGSGIEIARTKSSLFFGLEGTYFFGNQVKEDVIAQLRSYDGNIIGIDGQIGDVNLKQRGWFAGGYIGKVFKTTSKSHIMTGVRAQLGAGLLQHKIRVQDNYNSIVPLERKYLYGYDRLTNGPAIHLGLGFQYQSPVNNFHFKIMGELIGASTKSRRDIDFATGTKLEGTRTDIMPGVHLAYIVMISRDKTEEYIYY